MIDAEKVASDIAHWWEYDSDAGASDHAAKIRDALEAAYAAGLEDAARMAQGFRQVGGLSKDIAAAIRALKGAKP